PRPGNSSTCRACAGLAERQARLGRTGAAMLIPLAAPACAPDKTGRLRYLALMQSITTTMGLVDACARMARHPFVTFDPEVVQRITGDSLDKSHRFTDWTRRPLSEAQLAYATSDVTHLRDVYIKLSADLEKRGRSDWMREEMKVLTSPATYRFEPEHAWERLKTRVRKPKELAVLIEVAAWREREAQERDVPRGRVLKDDVIGDIAVQAPTTTE